MQEKLEDMIFKHDVKYLSKHDVSVLPNIKTKSSFQSASKMNIRFICGIEILIGL